MLLMSGFFIISFHVKLFARGLTFVAMDIQLIEAHLVKRVLPPALDRGDLDVHGILAALALIEGLHSISAASQPIHAPNKNMPICFIVHDCFSTPAASKPTPKIGKMMNIT